MKSPISAPPIPHEPRLEIATRGCSGVHSADRLRSRFSPSGTDGVSSNPCAKPILALIRRQSGGDGDAPSRAAPGSSGLHRGGAAQPLRLGSI